MREFVRTPTVTRDGKLTRRRRKRSPLKRLDQLVPNLRRLGS